MIEPLVLIGIGFALGSFFRGAFARAPVVKMKEKLELSRLKREIEEQEHEINRMLDERIRG